MKHFLGVDFFICYNLFMSLATYILRITYTVVCLVLKARFVVLLAECDFSAARSRSTLVFCSTQVLAESDSDARERCDYCLPPPRLNNTAEYRRSDRQLPHLAPWKELASAWRAVQIQVVLL